MIFFFDTDDGRRRIADASGLDLRDADEAIEQAVSLLRDLSHVPVVPGTPRLFAVRVRGEAGRPLYEAVLDLRVNPVEG